VLDGNSITKRSRPCRTKTSTPLQRCPWSVCNRGPRRSGTGSLLRGPCSTWTWKSLTTCPATARQRAQDVQWPLPSGYRQVKSNRRGSVGEAKTGGLL
jgi:hypothetical protein